MLGRELHPYLVRSSVAERSIRRPPITPLLIAQLLVVLLIAWSLLLGTSFFIIFGWLSDKIGRKPIILTGCLIAALSFFPIFKAITTNANPALEKAIETVKVQVVADPAGCGDLFNPVGTRVFTAPCDTARAFLSQSSIKYSTVSAPAGSGVRQPCPSSMPHGCTMMIAV